ncbi:MAG: tRNA glutamyl-Q(34) synthetase GluQRS [Alicyclobacillus sp.]|nr:tRNA glutamyl-Q(34) synthetase GluQRS [Alicyclobacillus sp.]
MVDGPVRGRFAPTPSGFLHLGNALTALLAWLQVRQLGGDFILRVEDLDERRFHPVYADALLDDLRWLGIDWDEGPDVGGARGPYRQRDRLALYEAALAELRAQGRLYPCFCSRKQLTELAQAPHGLASEGPVYNGACRHLSAAERARRAKLKDPSWRFALPEVSVAFDDLAAGPQWFPPGTGGDFVVFRADGVFAYQLAVVVDDAAMGVTHVLRGADLLDSTPRQLHLYAALGWAPPLFAHVPLLCGADGARLAKRDQSVTLRSLRAAGATPERVTGYLAFAAGLLDHPEAVSPRELVSHFSFHRLRQPPRVAPADVENLVRA